MGHVRDGLNYFLESLEAQLVKDQGKDDRCRESADKIEQIQLYGVPEKLCEITGMTKSYFSKLFEVFTGMSFNDYLNQKRISFAEKLLIYPDLSTTDISMKVGYNSLSTFNRAFRMIKKCSPTEYRSYATSIAKPAKVME